MAGKLTTTHWLLIALGVLIVVAAVKDGNFFKTSPTDLDSGLISTMLDVNFGINHCQTDVSNIYDGGTTTRVYMVIKKFGSGYEYGHFNINANGKLSSFTSGIGGPIPGTKDIPGSNQVAPFLGYVVEEHMGTFQGMYHKILAKGTTPTTSSCILNVNRMIGPVASMSDNTGATSCTFDPSLPKGYECN